MSRLRGSWMGWAGPVQEDAARAAFEAKYGQEPRRVCRAHGLTLVGPIPQDEKGADDDGNGNGANRVGSGGQFGTDER